MIHISDMFSMAELLYAVFVVRRSWTGWWTYINIQRALLVLILGFKSYHQSVRSGGKLLKHCLIRQHVSKYSLQWGEVIPHTQDIRPSDVARNIGQKGNKVFVASCSGNIIVVPFASLRLCAAKNCETVLSEATT